jgi:Ca2+-binding RTX toxin-like protein
MATLVYKAPYVKFPGNLGLYVDGTESADTLYGSTGNDSIYGRGGNDYLIGKAGNDLLDGGTATICWTAARAATRLSAVPVSTP